MRWLTEKLGYKLGDTLGRRLFLLMWVALVGSQALAFAADWLVYFRNEPMPQMHLPVFPSLPPVQALSGRPAPDHAAGPPGHAPGFSPDGRPPELPGEGPGPGPHDEPRNAFPTGFYVLDYGVRLLVIALAAWRGSRWLARPVEQLSKAAEAVGEDATSEPPRLDEGTGTRELRKAAHVFNTMAARLKRRFDERSLLVAALSHDLRTPLTRLRMRLESMGLPPQQRQRCVADIGEMNTLINSALDVFRDDVAGTRESKQVTDVGALVLALVDDLAEQGQEVTFNSSGGNAVASVQALALRRVLGNLISNALRYGQRADVLLQAQPDVLLVHVDDAGPGIAPAQQEMVFQPFYRLESSRNRDTGGAGLGLYIARKLAQSFGGSLGLSNRAEGGLRATVRIPR